MRKEATHFYPLQIKTVYKLLTLTGSVTARLLVRLSHATHSMTLYLEVTLSSPTAAVAQICVSHQVCMSARELSVLILVAQLKVVAQLHLFVY